MFNKLLKRSQLVVKNVGNSILATGVDSYLVDYFC